MYYKNLREENKLTSGKVTARETAPFCLDNPDNSRRALPPFFLKGVKDVFLRLISSQPLNR